MSLDMWKLENLKTAILAGRLFCEGKCTLKAIVSPNGQEISSGFYDRSSQRPLLRTFDSLPH